MFKFYENTWVLANAVNFLNKLLKAALQENSNKIVYYTVYNLYLRGFLAVLISLRLDHKRSNFESHI